MSKSQQVPASSPRAWNAPRLVRIGTIVDVAGPAGIGVNGSATAKS